MIGEISGENAIRWKPETPPELLDGNFMAQIKTRIAPAT